MAFARTSTGKTSLTVRYAALAPEDAKKKITHHHTVWVTAFKAPASKSTALNASNTPESR